MIETYSIARWNALTAYQIGNYELHDRAERCAPLWERIYGEVAPELRRRAEHWLQVRRIGSAVDGDVLINPLALQSAARIHTCVFLGDNVGVLIDLQQLRAVQAYLPVWRWGPCYSVTPADLDSLNVGYRVLRWPGVAGAILGL